MKVLHPGVNFQVYSDVMMMRLLASSLCIIPSVKWLSLRETVQQFADRMCAHLDLRQEAQNLEKFSQNFSNTLTVIFPKPIYPLTSKSVLVESFETGIQLTQNLRAKSDLNAQIANIGFHSFLMMVFKHRFVRESFYRV